MRTQAHRIVDTNPHPGYLVVRVTGTRHDEPTYQVRQSLPTPRRSPVVIQAHQLTKRYGDKTAVHTLSCTGRPEPAWRGRH